MAGFFDKMVDGLNRGISTVSENTKIFAEKASLNTQIKDIEKEKLQLLQNIGTLVYNLHATGGIQLEQCADMCGEITSMDMKIVALREKLNAIEAMKNQPVKPAQYVQTIVPASETAVVNGTACECGYVNKEGAKFCAKCGKQLKATGENSDNENSDE